MSVIVQAAPYDLRDGDWDDGARGASAIASCATLEAVRAGAGQLVTARQVLTPLDLERDYGLTGGHPMHGEHGLDQFFAVAAAARPRALPDARWAASTWPAPAPIRAVASPACPARTPPARSSAT